MQTIFKFEFLFFCTNQDNQPKPIGWLKYLCMGLVTLLIVLASSDVKCLVWNGTIYNWFDFGWFVILRVEKKKKLVRNSLRHLNLTGIDNDGQFDF